MVRVKGIEPLRCCHHGFVKPSVLVRALAKPPVYQFQQTRDQTYMAVKSDTSRAWFVKYNIA